MTEMTQSEKNQMLLVASQQLPFGPNTFNREKIYEALELGADINARDAHGNTALIGCILNGEEGVALDLVGRGANVNVMNDRDDTPLLLAAARKMPNLCMKLIDRGADVNEAYGEDGGENTALHLAARSGHENVCLKMIELKADINAINTEGMTPIFMAAENNLYGVCEKMLEAGADANAHNKENQSVLGLALCSRNATQYTFTTLLRYGAKLSKREEAFYSDPNDEVNETLRECREEMLGSVKNAFPEGGKITRDSCYKGIDENFDSPHFINTILNACATGQFATLIGVPLLVSNTPEDRKLFEDIWKALPECWRTENMSLHTQFIKLGSHAQRLQSRELSETAKS